MKKLIFFTFFIFPALCIGQMNVSDPISSSTAFSRGNSIGPDNPHFLLNKGEKAIYLSYTSHLLSKELKGVKSDILLSNRLLDAKFSISGYGYKHYKQLEIATSSLTIIAISRVTAGNLLTGVYLTLLVLISKNLVKSISK